MVNNEQFESFDIPSYKALYYECYFRWYLDIDNLRWLILLQLHLKS